MCPGEEVHVEGVGVSWGGGTYGRCTCRCGLTCVWFMCTVCVCMVVFVFDCVCVCVCVGVAR